MNFTVATPESVGIPSAAIGAMLDQLYSGGIEMHSFMLLRHGKLCAKGVWAPYQPGVPHIMFSFSKSLTSTAIGFAVQEGILSLDDRLVDIFPEYVPENPSENLLKCQLRHVLMMGCGHQDEIEWARGGSESWIRDFMHHPFVHEPGTHFMYNTAGTNLLSAMITKKTGLTLTQFLKPRLFQPLGMADVFCQAMADGTEMGGAGMSIPIEDMAAFVQFVANKGSWEGKQLLNSEWFDMATAKQIENAGAGWGGDPDWQAGYGFQFWRCSQPGVFRGDGAYGQYGLVMTEQDAVLVIQSACQAMQVTLDAVYQQLLPKMADGPLPEDPHAQHVLQKRLERLELNPLFGMRNPGGEDSLNGAVYTPDSPLPGLADLVGGVGSFTPAGGKLVSLGFRFDKEAAQLIVTEESGTATLDLGMNGHFACTDVNGTIYGANSAWRGRDCLDVQLRNIKRATGRRMLFRFAGSGMTVETSSTIPEEAGLGEISLPKMSFTIVDGEVSTKTKMYWETMNH